MSADTSDLTKVDSAIAVDDATHKDAVKETKRRTTSSAPGVMNINDLEKEGVKIAVAAETQKTGWKLNTSPSTVEDPSILKKLLTTPPVKKIDLHFPLGLEVTARNLKGVTIKDALDAIHKQFKKKADDEMEEPYLKGFEWDPEESWTRLKVHTQKEGLPVGKKSKKKGGDE
ncbi:hypothetical protein AYO21_03440 [Fonsecaea monophora]|uniref:Unplaced genomic scaffold supercont1.3, whole genome shotgun sequence n=2 Tax=Fonsecaea TaxID=40354 RepID=A0A0D2GNL2_9EURO|nr:uncharacterized protein Z517_05530 [Fonsecaea pedrosoi CBS 271.37]XP_022514224.1 hypothetical protein AYO21_03440 [Fonsecaea monophora]KAH0843150.1 hypothetical protein FOPE_08316 [Fonsecaea pedrosoi]KIW82503.1 hypothetical protein Z517_05530 [Fonsecaea pedrosoi CBS 271.37]OAG42272.1 hypothetical protein AYO21_03440 [Fonsecaea monophora]